MIMIAFFDVGETLIHSGLPFPGVAASLAAIAKFETADGRPLMMGIISDYYMPLPPVTEEKVAALEEQYRDQVLNPSGLAGFFEPFASQVTISSRAGASKPDRKVFEAAVARMGVAASLTECLFVTESVPHLNKCKEYGMTPIRFGMTGSAMAGFADWVDAPTVIAGIVAPAHMGNLAAATAAALDVRHSLVGFTMTSTTAAGLRGRANKLLQLNDPRLGPLNGIFVERPSEVTVDLKPDGRVASVAVSASEPEDTADAINFVASLMKSGRVAIPGQQAPPFGVTHGVEQDAEGRPRLIRRRYSAV